MPMKVLKTIRKDIMGIILEHLAVEDCVIFLFGSFARGKSDRASDIDVGIICDKKITRAKLAAVKSEIEEKVKTLRKVDVVDFYGIKNNAFLEVSLREVEVWHQTGKSKVFLSNLRKRIKD